MKDAAPFTIAIACGMLLWFVGAEATGRREAWDSGLYWTLFYPLAVAACGALGYLFPQRPWRWALALFFAQCLAMGTRNGEIGNLFPLGLIVFGVLSLPAIAVARLASNLKASRSRNAGPPSG